MKIYNEKIILETKYNTYTEQLINEDSSNLAKSLAEKYKKRKEQESGNISNKPINNSEDASNNIDNKDTNNNSEETSNTDKQRELTLVQKLQAKRLGISEKDYAKMIDDAGKNANKPVSAGKEKPSLIDKLKNKSIYKDESKLSSKDYVFVYSKEDLQDEIYNSCIKDYKDNLNYIKIDDSITDLSYLFSEHYSGDSGKSRILRNFNGNISGLDVSHITNFEGMFEGADFTGENGDLNDWDMSAAKNTKHMFYSSKYSGDAPSKWVFNHGCNIADMFTLCKNFEGSCTESWPVNTYDTSGIDSCTMFMNCKSTPSWISKYGIIKMHNRVQIQNKILEYCNIAKTNGVGDNEKIELNLNHFDVSDVEDFSEIFFSKIIEKNVGNIANSHMSRNGMPLNPNRINRTKNPNPKTGNKTPAFDDDSIMIRNIVPNVSQWDMRNAVNTDYMFAYSNGVDELDISKWQFTDKWKTADRMFYLSHFKGINLSGTNSVFNSESLIKLNRMFDCNDSGTTGSRFLADATDMIKPAIINFENEKTFAGAIEEVFGDFYPVKNMPEWYKQCTGISVSPTGI